ncbi:glycoside hydrolase family 32 protein [Rhodococcus opacus]|uniref:glycoside hydrolase family 32 protein n=1 Tax=Rhodococcus opacus TaxID=37919 RepID=UPI001FF3407F|nr:glycoside hydrolase family 32 protein [Rhodococcus opacus]UOT04173.1 glycoside hydrolase family 32 protein [Rhodococcus opacus]
MFEKSPDEMSPVMPASSGAVQRPQFHFTASTGWINDPCGITFRDGKYHVFYQYIPGVTSWAPDCRWGHASGSSLFALEELPVAIAPGDGDKGIWTGSLAISDDGSAHAFFTSTADPNIAIGRIRIATPSDEGWIAWHKGDIVASAPPSLEVTAYRDPFVLKDGASWRMLVGAALADGSAAALSYSSNDLKSWSYEGIAAQRSMHEQDPVWMGSLWECPQIIEHGGHHLLVTSVWDDDVLHYAGYAVGHYADGRFDGANWARLTYGPSYYAPSFFLDANGQPCLTFWMRGVEDQAAGWAGAHSIPHVLTVHDGLLVATPHPDLDNFHGEPIADGNLPAMAGDVSWLPAETDELIIEAAGEAVVTLSVFDSQVRATTASGAWTMPIADGVRVILDGPAIEISSQPGNLGLGVSPRGKRYSVRSASGEVSVRPLEKGY